jgi:hypothetical protein
VGLQPAGLDGQDHVADLLRRGALPHDHEHG